MGQSMGREASSSRSTGRQNTAVTLEVILRRAEDPKDHGVESIGLTYEQFLRRAARDIGARFYRSHQGTEEEIRNQGLKRSVGAAPVGIEYITAIICHTARTGGSEGKVLSLSSNIHVARRFRRPNTSFVTLHSLGNTRYQSIEKIILDNADLLLSQKRITAATLAKALRQIRAQDESEIFYLEGDIPASHIESIS